MYFYVNLVDYFITEVRRTVEDLCGRNDELVRPLHEISSLKQAKSGSKLTALSQAQTNTKNQSLVKTSEDERVMKMKDTRLCKSHTI